MNNNYKIRHQEVMMRTRSIFYDSQRGKPLAVSFLIRKNRLPPLNCSSERTFSNCLPAKTVILDLRNW